MSLGWVIAGTIAQAMLAMWLFMLAVFAGGGMANGNNLSPFVMRLLDLAMLALPGSSVVSACVVIYLYNKGAGPSSYWWYALPVAAVGLYFLFMSNIKR